MSIEPAWVFLWILFMAKNSMPFKAYSSLECFAMCSANSNCQGHGFDLENERNSCRFIIGDQLYTSYSGTFWPKKKQIAPAQSSRLDIVQATKHQPSNFILEATAAGFDKTLDLVDKTICLMYIPLEMDIEMAQYECLSQGGVLPMEDSEEFIDKMSAMVHDPISTRFVSLVRDLGTDPNTPHLMWQIGTVESMEVGPSHPKYTTWDDRHFVMNPFTKAFEAVSKSTQKIGFYCQYLGENLALNKQAYGSTTLMNQDHGPGVVNGVVGTNFWHADSELKTDWFAVNLGRLHNISRILFVSRRDCCGGRNRFIKAWVGNVAPPAGQDLKYDPYTLCGEYPYIQKNGYLSGIACFQTMLGQVVVLENGKALNIRNFLQLTEVMVF